MVVHKNLVELMHKLVALEKFSEVLPPPNLIEKISCLIDR